MKTKKRGTSLDKHRLYYEEMEKRPVKVNETTTPESTNPDFKTRVTTTRDELLQKIRKIFNNVVDKLNHPRKKSKKVTKIGHKLAIKQRNRAILGIGLLLVVVSILYSTFVIFVGVGTVESKIALIPQALFALIILIKAFSNLFKETQ